MVPRPMCINPGAIPVPNPRRHRLAPARGRRPGWATFRLPSAPPSAPIDAGPSWTQRARAPLPYSLSRTAPCPFLCPPRLTEQTQRTPPPHHLRPNLHCSAKIPSTTPPYSECPRKKHHRGTTTPFEASPDLPSVFSEPGDDTFFRADDHLTVDSRPRPPSSTTRTTVRSHIPHCCSHACWIGGLGAR